MSRGPVDRFLSTAANEVRKACANIDERALRAAARRILDAEAHGGRVHVTGVGKPEHLAHYLASLLASTGTPATFLHATEASHGGVGQLHPEDLVIAISNSGETRELLDCVAAIRGVGASLLAVTSDPDSALARQSDAVLVAHVDDEGGPLGLAPRASILVQMVVLQALSVELQDAKGLTREEYHRRHPAGKLGQLSSDDQDSN